MTAHTLNRTISHFITENGTKVPAITMLQMTEVDRIAMEETGPNLFQMMENAGRNLAEMAIQIWGRRWDRSTVVVLAGGGGNGGGGICAARHLANRNIDVRLCLANPDRMSDVTAYQHKIYQNSGGREIDGSDLERLYPDLIIDALIGYSLRGAPTGAAAEFIRWANQNDAPVLALDVPSGLDVTSGDTPGVHIQPKWTMTLALPKTGLLPQKTGDLWLADIGIPVAVYRQLDIDYNPPFGKRFRVAVSTEKTEGFE